MPYSEVELRLHSTNCCSGLMLFPVVKRVYVGLSLVFLPYSTSERKVRLFAMHSGMHHEVNDLCSREIVIAD